MSVEIIGNTILDKDWIKKSFHNYFPDHGSKALYSDKTVRILQNSPLLSVFILAAFGLNDQSVHTSY